MLPENILRRMSPEDRGPLGKAGRTKAEIEAAIDKRAEREIQRTILNYLNLHGIVPLFSRFGVKSTMPPGTPDILFAFNGRPCAWEIKTASGILSDDQMVMAGRLAKNGWCFQLIRSLDDARCALAQLKNRLPIIE